MHTIGNIFNFSFFLRKTIMNDQKSLRFICIIENRHTCAKEGMHARRHACTSTAHRHARTKAYRQADRYIGMQACM